MQQLQRRRRGYSVIRVYSGYDVTPVHSTRETEGPPASDSICWRQRLVSIKSKAAGGPQLTCSVQTCSWHGLICRHQPSSMWTDFIIDLPRYPSYKVCNLPYDSIYAQLCPFMSITILCPEIISVSDLSWVKKHRFTDGYHWAKWPTVHGWMLEVNFIFALDDLE